ncbi:MAG: hypothetical protein HOD63_07615 [Bacteroidetes bacterium]|jgi:hypothetical protein|nr:hypothetical protein [Bacteroidota bacterium]MBT5527560.1 hypothetical protein [Cytophagia bacterium]MBT6753500.1 hypothetical protein [bacterium]MBT4338440.1 hypothetical protein [Bacteroidota bacterium]MBT4970195.1 hypothetical protein [Bacteroidota bacterium]
METRERRILVSLVTTILVFVFYTFYIYKRQVVGNPEIVNDLQFWGKTFMLMIPVAIVAQIIMHILFAIINKIMANEDEPKINDERDKLIELKALKLSHWIFAAGFILAMGSQALGMKVWVMFVTLVVSGLLSTMLEEIIKLYYYKRGF